MDLYLNTPIVYEIYGYMTWNDLRYWRNVPASFWNRMYETFEQDEEFKVKMTDYWSGVRVNTGANLGLLTTRDKLLGYLCNLSMSTTRDHSNIPRILWNDKAFILLLLRCRTDALPYVSKLLQTDRDIVIAAVKQDVNITQYTEFEWKTNPDLALIIIKHVPAAYACLDIDLKTNTAFIYKSLQINAEVAYFFNWSIQNNTNIMLYAGQQAAKQRKLIWSSVGRLLKNDPTFVTKYVRMYNSIF